MESRRRIRAKYSGYCPFCGEPYQKGTLIEFDTEENRWQPVKCLGCGQDESVLEARDNVGDFSGDIWGSVSRDER
jgi:hypothetical protein